MGKSKNKLESLSTSELKALHENSFGGTGTARKQLYRADNPWATGQPGDPFARMRKDASGRKRPTRAQAKENLEQIYNVPKDPNGPNWVKARELVGLKKIDSQSDLNALHREVHMEHDRRHTNKATKPLEKRITELENRPTGPAEQEKPKNDLVIHSPEVSRGKLRVDNYETEMAGYQNSSPGIFDGTPDSNKQGNIFDESTTADTPSTDPQAFADQYKLNLINTGATKKPTDETPNLVNS